MKEADIEDEREERKLENDKNVAKIRLIQDELDEILKENQDMQLEVKRLDGLLKDTDDELRRSRREAEDSKIQLDDVQV